MPTKPASPPPILVAVHYCGGSANAMYNFTNMDLVEELAEQYGVIMIFPQSANNCGGPLFTGSNAQSGCSAACWDVGSTAALTNGGNGDTEAIAEMIQYEVSKNGANPNRVYLMGDSSGAMMVEALAAVYPNVFQAGAEYSGVPAGCWSDGYTSTGNWANPCALGQDMMSAANWGKDVAKMGPPGYSGPRPRLQLYHGSDDTTINYGDQIQAVLEWTNVLLGLTPTPSSLTAPPTAASLDVSSSGTAAAISGEAASADDVGFTEWDWKNSCGFTVLQAFTDVGGNHNTTIDPQRMWDFFGLTNPTGPDPEADCGDAGTSTSGSSSNAGSSGTGGGGSGGSGSSGSLGNSSGGGNGSTTGGNGSTGTGSTTGGGANSSSTGGSTGGNGATSGSGSSDESGGKSIAGGCAVTMPGTPGSAGAMITAGLLGLALCGRRRRRD